MPKAVQVTTPEGGTTLAKPTTQQLSINLKTGEAGPGSKPISDAALKNIKWQPPVIALQATGSNKVGATGKVVITYVGDGDQAKSDLQDCRLDGIDAPETAKPKYGKPNSQAYGLEAKKTLQDMILKKEVTIRVTKAAVGTGKDKANNYGRDVCQIEIEGVDVNLAMVREGAAQVIPQFIPDSGRRAAMLAAEAEAKVARRGQWKGEGQITPFQFRKSQQ
jgi:endonuclease YncB( thermonuclease family)